MNRDKAYLTHIRDAIKRIEEYTGEGQTVFLEDQRTQDAVLRNLEVIGEAVKNLSAETREAHPDVPWRALAGMRDKLIHHYFGVDLELVWASIDRDLPKLKDQILRLLDQV